MDNLHDFLRSEMCYAKNKHQQHANASHTSASSFNHGDQVWVSTKTIGTACPLIILDHKQLVAFPVSTVVGSHAYHPDLPPTMKIHPVSRVSLQESASSDPITGQVMPAPQPVELEGHEELEVEEVLDSRLHYRKPQYLIKWLGYDAPIWQVADDLKNSPQTSSAFTAFTLPAPAPDKSPRKYDCRGGTCHRFQLQRWLVFGVTGYRCGMVIIVFQS